MHSIRTGIIKILSAE